MENKKKIEENMDKKAVDTNLNEKIELSDNDLEEGQVAGGYFGFGEDYEDGHEKTCASVFWHTKRECRSSDDGYHYWKPCGANYKCTRCDRMLLNSNN